jgi:hypothetical protein
MKAIKCKCGKPFKLGVNGVITDNDGDVCDECAGVKRDKNGYTWFPDDIKNGFLILLPVDETNGAPTKIYWEDVKP